MPSAQVDRCVGVDVAAQGSGGITLAPDQTLQRFQRCQLAVLIDPAFEHAGCFLDAERTAARADASIARAELRPQITYSLNAGFDAASLGRLRQYSGGSLLFSVNVPIFNFGASRSRQRQAELRAAAIDVQRQNVEKQLSTEFYRARAAMNSAFQRIRYTREAAVISQRGWRVRHVAMAA